MKGASLLAVLCLASFLAACGMIVADPGVLPMTQDAGDDGSFPPGTDATVDATAFDGGSDGAFVDAYAANDATVGDGGGDSSSNVGKDAGLDAASDGDANPLLVGCEYDGAVVVLDATSPGNACALCEADGGFGVWGTAPNGRACGSGSVCNGGLCELGCYIDGGFVAPDAAEPNNPCQVCQPVEFTMGWTALTNGTTCGVGAVCDLGNCSLGCFIDGGVGFQVPDAANSNNQCQTCQPNANTTGWTVEANGAPCGNGQFCSNGTCGTACDIDGSVYDSGAIDPSNACQSCQPGKSLTGWTSLSNGTGCGDAGVCFLGSCSAGCVIDGGLVAPNAPSPGNTCESCQPTSNSTNWSFVAGGTSCDAGNLCDLSPACHSGVCASTTVVTCTALDQCHTAGTCDPLTGSCSNPTGNQGNSCDAGNLCALNPTCQSGTCTAVGTVTCTAPTCYTAGTCIPSSGCPAPVAQTGTSCGPSNFCRVGVCEAACDIGGTIYDAGVVNAANACQYCQPGVDAGAWSAVAGGSSCDAGAVCNGSGTCEPGCYLDGGVVGSGVAQQGNACLICAPSASTGAWSFADAGTPCTSGGGDVCNSSGQCVSGCFIDDTYYTPGASNPSNACLVCTPSVSTGSWSLAAVGAPCSSNGGNFCNSGSCFSGCLLDGGTVVATGGTNPFAGYECMQCQPATSSTGWTSVPNDTNPSGCPRTGAQACWNGACVTPMRSCLPGGAGMSNCGDAGTDNCCTSLEVDAGADGGTYDRTYPDNGNGEDAGYPATVNNFRLDKYLVTVGRFRQFANAVMLADGGLAWTPPSGSGKHSHLNNGAGLQDAFEGAVYEPGWSNSDDEYVGPITALNAAVSGGLVNGGLTWTVDAGSQENLPMSGVTWQEAYAFCIWDGAFLPSEAEWEFAAAGGNQQLEYPWGSAGGVSPSGQYAIYGCNWPYGSADCNVQNVAPVGSAPLGAGVWGQLDLVGEVWEWTMDWYASAYSTSTCINCADLTNNPNSDRVVRGGSYEYTGSPYLLPPDRSISSPPTVRNGFLGFRCARTP